MKANEDSKYIAVYNDSADTGIGIVDFEYGIEDYCITEYFTSKEKKRTRNKIHTDSKDSRDYIVKYGKRYYIDQFIKG